MSNRIGKYKHHSICQILLTHSDEGEWPQLLGVTSCTLQLCMTLRTFPFLFDSITVKLYIYKAVMQGIACLCVAHALIHNEAFID